MIESIFILLFLFQLKHFLCDFPLQGRYMLGKFGPGWTWITPLLAHVGVHAAGTLAICWAFNPKLWFLCFLDAGLHFAMDTVKARPLFLGRFKDMTKPYFWWSLGLDQGFHHCTHYLLIYLLVVA